MPKVCESLAIDYHIKFNLIKSKLIGYNVDSSMCPPIYLNNQPITIINSDKYSGNFISSDIQDRNVISSVCNFYQRRNRIISDFSSCNSESLDSLYNTFCMHMWMVTTQNRHVKSELGIVCYYRHFYGHFSTKTMSLHLHGL